MTHLLRIVTTVRKRKVPITGIKIIKMEIVVRHHSRMVCIITAI